MTGPGPWAVRSEAIARRLGSPVAVTSLSIPTSTGVDEQALGEWHLQTLVDRHAGLRVDDLTPVAVGSGAALMRYGTFSGPESGHLIALYRAVRGMLQAIVAQAPAAVPADALSRSVLEWIEHEASVHLTVEEFRVIERMHGASPAAFVARSPIVAADDDAPGGAVDVIARSLAVRGILQRAGEDEWELTAQRGAVVEPLVGSRHVVWLTWVSSDGAGAAAIGRTTGAWSLLEAEDGGLRLTALDAATPAETAAALGGVSADVVADASPPRDVPPAELRPGRVIEGIGTVAACAAATFVRPVTAGLEHMELQWLHDDRGRLWELSAEPSGRLTARPIDGSVLTARISEGFESEGEHS